MRKLAAVGLVAVLVVVLGGCGFFKPTSDIENLGQVVPTGGAGGLDDLSTYKPTVEPELGETVDDVYVKIAKAVPGFGGMFLDLDEVLNVYLLNPEKTEDLESTIVAHFGRWVLVGGKIKILQGEYDFIQLYEWHNKLLEIVSIPGIGITMTDIDDDDNRITIGVEDLRVQDQIERELVKLNIPLKAVQIEQRGPMEFTSTRRLTEEIRPVVAGVQTNSFPGLCTLGLVARRNNVPGFIVNSHCTRLWGQWDGTGNEWHQPVWADGIPYFIGREAVDPQYFTNSENSACPVNWKCRWTDSAFVTRASGVTSELGHIARPDGLTTDPNNPVLTFSSLWAIVLVPVVDPPIGTVVNKVGKTTGWTQGRVLRTCVRFFTGDSTYRAVLCGHMASFISANGDSGSPVFSIRPNYPGTVVLWGIHFAVEAGDAVSSVPFVG